MLRDAQSGFSHVFDIPCMCPLCLKAKDYMPKVIHFSDVTCLETPPSLNKNNQEYGTLVELSNSCKKYGVIKVPYTSNKNRGTDREQKRGGKQENQLNK